MHLSLQYYTEAPCFLAYDRFMDMVCRGDKEAACHSDRQQRNQSKERLLERFVSYLKIDQSVWRGSAGKPSLLSLLHKCATLIVWKWIHWPQSEHKYATILHCLHLFMSWGLQVWRTWKSLRAQTSWWTTEVMKLFYSYHTHTLQKIVFCGPQPGKISWDDTCTA